MLTLSAIKENPQEIIRRLAVKHFDAEQLINEILDLDKTRRSAQAQLDQNRSEQNKLAAQIGALMKAGNKDEAEKVKNEVASLKDSAKSIEEELKTAKVLFGEKIEIDFASTRQEFYPRRGHLPVVARIGCTLEEDVYRRDFTINSLAVALNKENYGNVIDYTGGIADLKNKVLKILHDNSFNEDPSRIIRGFLFLSDFVSSFISEGN